MSIPYISKKLQTLYKLLRFEIAKPGEARGEYTRNYPYTYATYSPWFEPGFLDMYAKIEHHTVVSEDRCYILDRLTRYAVHLPGDFAECGVYKGGTTFLIASVIAECGSESHLHLFDTFAGMPSIAQKPRDGHKPGDFGDTSLESVKSYLAQFPGVQFHLGTIPDTFSDILDEEFSFVHIDVDIYPTTLECCKFFYPRLVRGGILICDDYGFPGYKKAAKAAVDEFFQDKPGKPIPLHTGQCFIIKL